MHTNIKFLALALFMAFTSFSFAQISVGLRTGLTINKVYTTDGLGSIASSLESIDEANTALVVEIPIATGFSIQPELAYTTKGFSLQQGLDAQILGVDLPLNASAETRIRYIEMPVLAKYKFGDKALKAYVALGPHLAYATKGKIDTKVRAILEFNTGSVPLNLDDQNYQRLDVGASLAAGVEYNFGAVALFADARYSRGFSELYNIPVLEEKVRNTAYGFNIGLKMPIAF